MRRIERLPLAPTTQRRLDAYQARLTNEGANGGVDIDRLWRAARQTQALGGDGSSVVATLRKMCGARERCMYCMDSHGCDIEHFRPKARFPEQTFRWTNLLLCCSGCGRLKGSQFPILKDIPQLIDPTAEDPWEFIDFDPETGNLVPRFDVVSNTFSSRGSESVSMFRLDRREALSDGYLRTFRRLRRAFQSVLDAAVVPDENQFVENLSQEDEHGLLPWCLSGAGRRLSPFSEVEHRHPTLWESCRAHFV